MLRIAWIVTVVALALAGCGGDDGDSGDSAGSASASGSASAPAEESDEADPAADQAAADEAVAAFVAEVEAAGFTTDPEDDEEEDSDPEFQTEECRKLEAAFPDDGELDGETAEAESGSFVRGDVLDGGEHTVEGSVVYAEDSDAYEEMFELLQSDDFLPCMREAFEGEIEKQAAEDAMAAEMEIDIDVEESEPVDDVDDQAGLRITGTIGFAGLSIEMDATILIVREDRRGAFVSVLSVGGQPDDVSAADLIRTLLG
jgi:hypothetical protein